MKKILSTTFLSLMLCLSGVFLVACCGEEPAPTTYNITLPTSADYTVESDKEVAEFGQEVTLIVTLLNDELVIEDVLANGISCEENYNGTFSFTMPAENVSITVQTSRLQEVHSTEFVWLDDGNLYTITEDGDGTFDGDTRDINITFAEKQGMTIINEAITSSNQNVIPDTAINFEPITDININGSSGSSEILKGVIEINPFEIHAGTTYLTMEFVNGNYSYGSSNRGTLIVKITVVPYGELTLETVREELVIDLFSELQYQTGDIFCLRIGDSDHVDGSSNPSYVDYVLTMESIRELSVEFDYILGHSYWIRLVEGDTQPDIPVGYISEFVFDNSIESGDEEGEYTGYYNGSLMYMEANDRVTIDAERNPALED